MLLFLVPLALKAVDSSPEVSNRASAQPVSSSSPTSSLSSSTPSTSDAITILSTPVPDASRVQSPKKLGAATQLKILTRECASILVAPSETATVLQTSTTPFSIFYVYSQQPGWLQVGKTKRGDPFGWIREKDAIFWKGNLVMEFTHPSNRIPVLFFKNKDDIKRIALEPSKVRSAKADLILSQIKSNNISDSFPVDAVERGRPTGKGMTFGIFPITGFEEIQIDGRDGRLLKLAVRIQDPPAEDTNNLFNGASVDWLPHPSASVVSPPSDTELWVVDRDLKNPGIFPMKVKVMLQKDDLDALVRVLEYIVTAGVRGQVTGQRLFEELQSAVASAITSPDQIHNAMNLAVTGLLPDFLADLPYKSRLMVMDPATWNAMSVDCQCLMLEQVQEKIKCCEAILKDPQLWHSFNPDDPDGKTVAFLSLDQLP